MSSAACLALPLMHRPVLLFYEVRDSAAAQQRCPWPPWLGALRPVNRTEVRIQLATPSSRVRTMAFSCRKPHLALDSRHSLTQGHRGHRPKRNCLRYWSRRCAHSEPNQGFVVSLRLYRRAKARELRPSRTISESERKAEACMNRSAIGVDGAPTTLHRFAAQTFELPAACLYQHLAAVNSSVND